MAAKGGSRSVSSGLAKDDRIILAISQKIRSLKIAVVEFRPPHTTCAL